MRFERAVSRFACVVVLVAGCGSANEGGSDGAVAPDDGPGGEVVDGGGGGDVAEAADVGADQVGGDERNGVGGDASECVACVPDCEGKACGGDGCGGWCWECQDHQACMLVGAGERACVVADPPQCEGKVCGPDSFGGSCGKCPDGWSCGDAGGCVPDGGCAAVPAGGQCVIGSRVTCDEGVLEVVVCPFRECVETDAGAVCASPECVPACFGRQCGDDGCGGSCGACGPGESCEGGFGVCVPEAEGCGGEDVGAQCLGHTLAACVGGKLELEDCLASGRVCGAGECGGPVACRPPLDEDGCGELASGGQCAGAYFVRCDEGRVVIDDCRQAGETCRQVELARKGCGAR